MGTSTTETTLNHFSHPHPLHLISSINIHQNSSHINTCSGCKSQISPTASSSMIYTCKTCNYFLHTSCSKMPQQITHPFDHNKGHVLTLRPCGDGSYNYCDACGKQGKGFCYHCKICKIHLHSQCASTPLTFSHQSHPQHQLKLLFSPTHRDKKFTCDVCHTQGSNHWLYRCDICDFDVHLNCKNVPVLAHPEKQPNFAHHYHQNVHTPIGSKSVHYHHHHHQVPPSPPHHHNVHTPVGSKSAHYHNHHHQVPPPPHHQGPNFHQPINPGFQGPNFHPATGVPINNQGIDPAVLMAILQRLEAQNMMNQQQIQALLNGGGRTGGMGGMGGFGGIGGIANLVQALSGIPGLDLLSSGLDLGSLLGGFGF